MILNVKNLDKFQFWIILQNKEFMLWNKIFSFKINQKYIINKFLILINIKVKLFN